VASFIGGGNFGEGYHLHMVKAEAQDNNSHDGMYLLLMF
jgi:hypothetical protein